MKNTQSVAPSRKRNAVLSIIAVIVIAAIMFVLESNAAQHNYAISIIERSLIYAIVAVAMNLLTGFTGLFSLGQAGFMAIGAYTVAIFTIPVDVRPNVYYISGINEAIANIQLPFPVALILGGLLAAALAALIGIPVLRLKSDYLAIATLGISEIIRAVISAPQMDRITNGSYGLKNIPGFSTIFTPTLIAVVCIGIIVLLINSSYGRAFKAIRENDVAAEAMGINLFKHKQMAFIVSSFFTGNAHIQYPTYGCYRRYRLGNRKHHRRIPCKLRSGMASFLRRATGYCRSSDTSFQSRLPNGNILYPSYGSSSFLPQRYNGNKRILLGRPGAAV